VSRSRILRRLCNDRKLHEVVFVELFVVPRGVEHKPFAAREVELLLIEPRGILNTGHAGGERTAQNDLWI
jgi:hypothetical protein